MEGYLLYDTKNEKNQFGCEDFHKYTEENPIVGDSPFIIVKKGLCSDTQKVRNIEEAGGHAAIIINDKNEPPEKLFLADDGHGADISIPAVLISLSDGQKLIEYYTSHPHDKTHRIRLEINFSLEKTDNTVKYDIWFTPDQQNVYTFLNDFLRYQKLLDDKAILGVHYITYPYFSYDPSSNRPIDDCLGSGLYCVRPGNSGVNDGALIALESIKQKCIYQFTYQNKERTISKELFWMFMSKFHENCILTNNFNQKCSDNIINSVGLSSDEISKCILDSFIGTTYEKQRPDYNRVLKNKILDEEYEIRKRNYIRRVPSLTINGRLYDGSWRPEYVFDALCASLIKKPKVCFTEGTQKEVGFSGPAAFVIIMIVLATNIILFILCKNFIKKKMIDRIQSTDIDSRIDTVVNSYMALRDKA